MRKGLRISFIVLAALVTLFLYQLQRNMGRQKDETAFHKSISNSITIKSTDFESDGKMPQDVTDNGINHSPQLSWDTLPAGTKSLAIMVTDYDAPAPNLHLFTASHWVLYNIPLGVHSLAKGISVDQLKALGIDVGQNYAGKHIYTGPKPPFGEHHYYFRIYALDFDHLFLSNDNRDELYKAMAGHIVGYGELVGRF
jgi:Raf kinase inhibitor-like YbhB/YbcL family protein